LTKIEVANSQKANEIIMCGDACKETAMSPAAWNRYRGAGPARNDGGQVVARVGYHNSSSLCFSDDSPSLTWAAISPSSFSRHPNAASCLSCCATTAFSCALSFFSSASSSRNSVVLGGLSLSISWLRREGRALRHVPGRRRLCHALGGLRLLRLGRCGAHGDTSCCQ
jgi:hypothetical protein